MIAVDTNVLLRYILQDDPIQSPLAASLIRGVHKVLVTDAVLVEVVWTLVGKKYQQKKADIIKVILALFAERNVQFEDGQVVWKALNDYKKAQPVKRKYADSADALIINKSRSVIEKLGQQFDGSYTFDKAAQKLSGAKIPQ
ncbi:MAG: PIN domain-containing protein [Endozoicomonas sp.]